MKNYFLLFCLVIVNYNCFAQHKLTYDYTYYYDSLRPTNVIANEVVVINTLKERFYFEVNKIKKIEVDYLAWKNKEDPQVTWEKQGNIPYSKLNNYFIQNKNGITIFHSSTDRFIAKLNLDDNQQWILSDTKHENTNLKKATTTYLGRNWVAWYDETIPINDGPFLFKGLPGLIVELQDEHGYFNWKLASYKMNYDDNNFTRELLDYRIPKAMAISENELKNVFKQFFYDPGTSISSSGIVVDEEKMKKMIEFRKSQIHRYLIPDLWTYL